MSIKCIAIGNRIMGDDSIGIRVAEELSSKLKQKKIDLVIGETDIDYSLSKIEDEDFIFIIDSTYFNINSGSITITSLNEILEQSKQVYSQHQPSLINAIKANGKSLEGFIIGIEADEIDFNLELSPKLKIKFPLICKEVYRFIYHTIMRV